MEKPKHHFYDPASVTVFIDGLAASTPRTLLGFAPRPIQDGGLPGDKDLPGPLRWLVEGLATLSPTEVRLLSQYYQRPQPPEGYQQEILEDLKGFIIAVACSWNPEPRFPHAHPLFVKAAKLGQELDALAQISRDEARANVLRLRALEATNRAAHNKERKAARKARKAAR